MRIVYITAGAAGMLCGSCLHDNTLAAALQRKGHRVDLVPTYTPLRTDETDVSLDRVFYGALNVYLKQKWSWYRRAPLLLHWLLDRRPVLNWVSRLAGSAATQGTNLGALTLSMLRGETGHQRAELEQLVHWLGDEVRPEIVHLTNSMMLGLARSIRESLQVPVVCSVQGEDLFLDQIGEPYRTRVHDEIRRRAADVDAFIAPGRTYADTMTRYLGIEAHRMHIARLGVLLDGHAPAAREPAPEFTLGYLARICPDKGLHLLIEAFRILSERSRDVPVRLRVAGYMGKQDGPWVQSLRSNLAVWGLAERVEWLGEVDRAGKLRFLRQIDLLSVPTVYRESKGLPVLEAMASAVPVVQPAHGSFPEIVEATGGGLLVEPNSAQALADGILELINDRGRCRRLGEQGRLAVHAHFSDEDMAEDTLAVYRKVRPFQPG